MNNDIIVALATAIANNAISIIKVSGEGSIQLVNSIFKGKDLNKVASHTIHHGYIVYKNETLDEVLVSVFKTPKTFTKEDVVEINCHGGIFVSNKILEVILLNGARLSEPGEFTKRAFLNGRIDLTQAEAVMDIIESNTASSLKMANFGLLKETYKIIHKFRERVLECMLKIEVNIDYPEYEDEEQITESFLKPQISSLLKDIEKVLSKAQISKILKYGLKTVIIGKPNVGKSSLLNALLREDKAIVTNIAGTTRDIIEGSINIAGIALNLIDTAGIRETEDIIEKIGIEKTKEVLDTADLVILMFDYSDVISDLDRKLIELTSSKQRLIIVNKKDLKPKLDLSGLKDYVLISSFDKNDIEIIEKSIKKICEIGNINNIDASYIGNARQISKLKLAKLHLEEALISLNNGMPIDIANIDIQKSWSLLGEILGIVNTEEMIDELFSRFCLGK